MSNSWSPTQYDRFAKERRQPFLDLVALVRTPVARAVDLGCGTGETTAHFHRALGLATTVGVDSSAAMLEKSRAFEGGGLSFRQGAIETFAPDAPLDLVFSNAAFHWVPDHQALLRRLVAFLAPGGQLAVQLPAMQDAPTHGAAVEVASEEPFSQALSGATTFQTALSPEAYAKLLDELGAKEQHVRLQIYAHHLPAREDVVEWVRGSTLTAYQARLPADLWPLFLSRYRERLMEKLEETRPFLFLFQRVLMWGRW